MYNIIILSKAEKQLTKLEKSLQERILNTLERIRIRPFHFVKRKQGTPYYILRVGEYRVILDIKQNKLIILVVEVGHRKKIYGWFCFFPTQNKSMKRGLEKRGHYKSEDLYSSINMVLMWC